MIELPTGTHKLIVTKAEYASVARIVTVKKDKVVRNRIRLGATPGNGIRVHRTSEGQPDSGWATVAIATSPRGLTVFMNDLIVPQPTPVVFDIRAGIYELTIEKNGQVVYRKTLFARAGHTLELDLVIHDQRKIDLGDPWK